MRYDRGFTLIEMAIVLSVIGLLVGGSLMAVGPALQKTYVTQTNTNMDQIENALVLFAIRNNRLPCPADGSASPSSTTFGMESAAATLGAGSWATATCPVASNKSIVPWKTLGMNEQYSIDGWGRRISYYPANANITGVSGALVYNDASASGGGSGVPSDNCLQRNTSQSQNRAKTSGNCDPTDVYSLGETNTYPFDNYIAIYGINSTYTDCLTELTQPNTATTNAFFSGTDTCATTIASTPVTSIASLTAAASLVPYDGLRAAYVLISHGRSGWNSWTVVGTQITPPTGTTFTLKQYNDGTVGHMAGKTGGLGFVQSTAQIGSYPTIAANYFDDVVRWRTPSYIIQQCGSGGCGNP